MYGNRPESIHRHFQPKKIMFRVALQNSVLSKSAGFSYLK